MANTLATSSGTITLPDDMIWSDVYRWSPVAQQWEISLGGSQIVEMSTQLFGRPITLIGEADGPWMSGAEMEALRNAEIAQGDTPMTLTLDDGRTFTVLFFYGGGQPAVSAEQVLPRSPSDSTEVDSLQYIPTIRLKQIG